MGSNLEAVLHKLREICLRLPEAEEVVSYGNPAFKANKKLFCVLDNYKGTDMIYFKADPAMREALLARPHFTSAPYDPKKIGVCRDLEDIDWGEVEALIIDSYRSIALRRMLDAFDGN